MPSRDELIAEVLALIDITPDQAGLIVDRAEDMVLARTYIPPGTSWVPKTMSPVQSAIDSILAAIQGSGGQP